jgi:hypothetical protein
VDFQLSQPPFDLYYANDTKNYGVMDLGNFLLYLPFSYLFAYLFDKWRIRGVITIFYIVGWTLVGIGYESLTVHFHVFTYTGWELKYSFMVYFIVQSCHVWCYHLVKRRYIRTKSQTGREWF